MNEEVMRMLAEQVRKGRVVAYIDGRRRLRYVMAYKATPAQRRRALWGAPLRLAQDCQRQAEQAPVH